MSIQITSLKHTLASLAVSSFLLAGATLAIAQTAPDATLAAAAKEPGAKVTESGLVFRALKEGKGAQPTAESVVKVHYKGTFPDGKEFDSSHKRGEPTEFPLNRVIKCWTEGVQKMKVGGKAKIVCPSDLAYGDRGAPPKIKPGSTLVFDVTLNNVL